jgi:lipopolysaccharide/colanic/teichoic acid biosynthesis glycosyltransferase
VSGDDQIPYPLVKRITDRLLAALLLAAAAPLLLAVLAAMAMDMLAVPDDRGPFLYRERRVSRGRPFELLKFRTLRTEALAKLDSRGYVRLLEADPLKLTRAGRLLKRWYLDELPQLVNIVCGDISLVGPRPWPPAMVDEQVAHGLDYRNRIQAGWTGLAQIAKGRPGTSSYSDLDLAYVTICKTSSAVRLLAFDLTVLCRTVVVLARGQGLQN